MTAKKDQTPAEGKALAPERKRPTPEQLATLRKGGDYKFNPTTGALVQTRKPTKPEAK